MKREGSSHVPLPTARPGADSRLCGQRQSALTHGQGEGGGGAHVGEGGKLAVWRSSSPPGLEANARYFLWRRGLGGWKMKAGMAERSRPLETPHPVTLPSPITASRQALSGARLRASASRTAPAVQGPRAAGTAWGALP